jgi:hypothetical protein
MQEALGKLVASGMNEDQARKILGLREKGDATL